MKVKIKGFLSRSRISQKATIGSACYDLFAAKSVVLEPNTTISVKTDLGFCFSKKCVAKIFPRSSLSLRSIHVGGGIVDADYTVNMRVTLTNRSNNRVEFNTGDIHIFVRTSDRYYESKTKIVKL